MAKFIESYTYEGIEGKPWAEVLARVQEFKAAMHEGGAKNITVLEGSLGSDQGTVTVMATFESHEAWGAWADAMYENKVFDAKMEEWQKNPRVMFKRGASYRIIE